MAAEVFEVSATPFNTSWTLLSLCAVSCGSAMEPDHTINAAAKETELFSDRDLSGEYDAAACERITLSDAGCTTDSKKVTVDGSDMSRS